MCISCNSEQQFRNCIEKEHQSEEQQNNLRYHGTRSENFWLKRRNRTITDHVILQNLIRTRNRYWNGGVACTNLTEQESTALIQYKGRDISEKLFRADKSFIGSKSERVQSSQSMSAKIFIEFVALFVRNRIYNLLKEQMLRMEARQKYMTASAAIHELEKIEMIRRNGGNIQTGSCNHQDSEDHSEFFWVGCRQRQQQCRSDQ